GRMIDVWFGRCIQANFQRILDDAHDLARAANSANKTLTKRIFFRKVFAGKTLSDDLNCRGVRGQILRPEGPASPERDAHSFEVVGRDKTHIGHVWAGPSFQVKPGGEPIATACNRNPGGDGSGLDAWQATNVFEQRIDEVSNRLS